MELSSPHRVTVISLLLNLWFGVTAALSDPSEPEPIDWASIRCPPEGSLGTSLPTPVYGSGPALFVACTEDIINVPPMDVYNALLDFRRYPTFSSFVWDIEFPEDFGETPDDVYIGLLMTFHSTGVIPLINTTSPEMVTVMKDTPDDGYRMVSWKYYDGLEGAFLKTEHPTILIDRGDGSTLCISYETYFSGPGAIALLPFAHNLQSQFAQHALDLKAYLEG